MGVNATQFYILFATTKHSMLQVNYISCHFLHKWFTILTVYYLITPHQFSSTKYTFNKQLLLHDSIFGVFFVKTGVQNTAEE